MKLKKIHTALTAALLAATMLLGGCADTDTSVQEGSEQTTTSTQQTVGDVTAAQGNELTSLEVIRLMGNGTNLGNTLEAYNHGGYLAGMNPADFETGWGQPYTSAEMIQGMKDSGFDTLRVPIAWTNGMNYESGDYTIDERLMARVEEIVNYALDADMYVIINDHWDGGWWGMFGSEDTAVREQAMELYKSMWTQIGERFKDYSYKLIFEAANEELGDRLNDKEITGSKGVLTQSECYEKAYEINSEFVKTIRAIGGNNADRFLLIAGYNTDIGMTCDERFRMPEDTAEDKLLLSVHYYTPWDYCGTSAVTQWGSPDDYEEMNKLFERLSKFSEQGYGVVIGEYAVMGGGKENVDDFYNNLLDNCDLYDFCPVLWDCSEFFKRRSLSWSDDTLQNIFDSRRYSKSEEGVPTDDIKAAARERIDAAYAEASEAFLDEVDILPADDKAVAWIMFQSGDWGVAYSVGDSYDPTNKTKGVHAQNAEITGEGTYTISLDFSDIGGVYGTAFSAIGISNGEVLFPDYTVTIDKILINNAPYVLAGKEYTSSDDAKCTRVNLYNGWVSKPPAEARTPDGDLTGCTAQIMPLGNKDKVESISITFTYKAP